MLSSDHYKDPNMSHINHYGDTLIKAGAGHGADIASQRADELDEKALSWIRQLPPGTASALDLGSGRGAQAARMAAAGAILSVASDREDFSTQYNQMTSGLSANCSFVLLDLLDHNFAQKIQKSSKTKTFDVIVFQRTIHYFSHAQALRIVRDVASLMPSGGRLYLSASGLLSELGNRYEHKSLPVTERFAMLAPDMADKHGILAPVCLYQISELIELCETAGLRVLAAQESSFGNIKVVAEKK